MNDIAIEELQKQLAAEREKVNVLVGLLGNCKEWMLSQRYAPDWNKQIDAALAKWKGGQMSDKPTGGSNPYYEAHFGDNELHSYDVAKQCREELAAERVKRKEGDVKCAQTDGLIQGETSTHMMCSDAAPTFEPEVRQLAAEREALATVRELRKEDQKALAAGQEAARKLCELYFNIAAEVIGEDAVRQKRDAALAKVTSTAVKKEGK